MKSTFEIERLLSLLKKVWRDLTEKQQQRKFGQSSKRLYYLKTEGSKIPHLAAVLVGNDGGSMSYVNAKVKACDEIGFEAR